MGEEKQIHNLINPEFYAKYAGIKIPAIVVMTLAQCVSGYTCYYFCQGVLGIDSHTMKMVVSITLALIPELMIKGFGHFMMIAVIEAISGKKVFEIEEGHENLSMFLVRVIIFAVVVCTVFTSFATVAGSYNYGFDSKDPGDQPEKEQILALHQADADKRKAENDVQAVKLQQRLEKKIEELKATYEENQKASEKEMRAYQKRKNQGYSQPWLAATSSANSWLNKGGARRMLDEIAEAEDELNESLKGSVAMKKEADQNAVKLAGEVFENESTIFGGKLNEARSSGGWSLVIGLIAQIIALVCLFVLTAIKVGTNTLNKRQYSPLNLIMVISQGLNVFFERQNLALAYKVSEYSKSKLIVKVNGEDVAVDVENPDNFSIYRGSINQKLFTTVNNERNSAADTSATADNDSDNSGSTGATTDSLNDSVADIFATTDKNPATENDSVGGLPRADKNITDNDSVADSSGSGPTSVADSFSGGKAAEDQAFKDEIQRRLDKLDLATSDISTQLSAKGGIADTLSPTVPEKDATPDITLNVEMKVVGGEPTIKYESKRDGTIKELTLADVNKSIGTFKRRWMKAEQVQRDKGEKPEESKAYVNNLANYNEFLAYKKALEKTKEDLKKN